MDVLTAVGRSAAIILSKQVNRHLTYYFSTAEIILIVTCMHSLMGTINSSGFTGSLHVLHEMVQSLLIQVLATWLGSGHFALFNVLSAILILECLPAMKGLAANDISAFQTNVTYIFSDKICYLMEGVPLIGTLGVLVRGDGLLSRTLLFTGVSTITELAFAIVSGENDLSVAWPIFLLYFVYEILRCLEKAEGLEMLFQMGIYKGSSAIYKQIHERFSALAMSVTFTFLSAVQPRDKVWTGITVLVIVQTISNHVLEAIILLCRTDAVLAGISVVTVIHFTALAIEAWKKLHEKTL
jgi:hypothetical protein